MGIHDILLGGNPEVDQYPMKGGRGGWGGGNTLNASCY